MNDHIHRLSSDDPDLMRKLMDAVNAHVSRYLTTYSPTPLRHDDQILSISQTSKGLGTPNVSELHSPTRVTGLAEKFGFCRGVALDLTVLDPDDRLPWDFSLKHKRDRAERMLAHDRTYLLILSPMCKAFSTLHKLKKKRMGKLKCAEMVQQARVHLAFAMDIAKQQLAMGN